MITQQGRIDFFNERAERFTGEILLTWKNGELVGVKKTEANELPDIAICWFIETGFVFSTLKAEDRKRWSLIVIRD
jgi:hypothetical protein